MITGENESNFLTKDISCECKCKFDGRKCNSDQWWNKHVNVSVKNVMFVKNIIFGILLHVFMKMENILQVLWMIKRLRAMKLFKKQKHF